MAPNTVRRILRDAGLWPEPAVAPASARPQSRTAEESGQTVNVDLCFVPATHTVASKLPAVSGPSGRLIIEAPVDTAAPPTYPGRIFEDATLSYEEAMQAYAAARPVVECTAAQPGAAELPVTPLPETGAPSTTLPSGTDEPPAATSVKARKRALHQTEAQLRDARRQTRARRRQEDAAWADLRQKRHATVNARRGQSARELQPQRATQDAEDETWRELCDQHRKQQAQRAQEDEQWRQQRQSLRAALAQFLS